MIELTNVINVSVSEPDSGLGEYNINNLALFVTDAFLVPGTDVFRIYKSAASVGTDFGLSTDAYDMAVAVFSQQPNILAGGGELVIFPQSAAETLVEAIARTKDLTFYTGMVCNFQPTGADRTSAAATIESYDDKMWFLHSTDYDDVAGAFTDIKDADSNKTRCLLHTVSADDALKMACAAASRGMAVDFDGSNTALTMNLKTLKGINEDTGITQTYYSAAKTAGVDLYVSYAGSVRYVSNGANDYFDNVFNLIWIVATMKVTGFNTLATVSTKIPQTEPGMSLIKAAFRKVCEKAVRNGYVAPGSWNSSEWFGSQEDMINNIEEFGYYIYTQPVNLQSAAVRATRVAPTVQIAIKLAGAVHSLNVHININA